MACCGGGRPPIPTLTSNGLPQASPLYGYWFRAVQDGKHYVSFYKVSGQAVRDGITSSGCMDLVSVVAFSSARPPTLCIPGGISCHLVDPGPPNPSDGLPF